MKKVSQLNLNIDRQIDKEIDYYSQMEVYKSIVNINYLIAITMELVLSLSLSTFVQNEAITNSKRETKLEFPGKMKMNELSRQ